MIRTHAMVALLPLLACATVARAQTPEEQPDASANAWEFSTVTYAWISGIEGEADVIGPVDPVGIDLSMGNALDALKFAFMGAAEARRDRLVLMGDLTFFHVEFDKGIDIRNQDFLDAELDSRTIDVTALGGYRVVDKGPMTVDLLAGARANFLKNSLHLEGPNREAAGSVSETWFDPLIAARTHIPFSDKFGMSLYGDVGGFGIASDITWQGVATLDYSISRKFRILAGWRHFKVDFDKGDFLYDAAQSGPIVAVRYTF